MTTAQENAPKKENSDKKKKIVIKNASQSLNEYVKLRTAFIKKHQLDWPLWEIAK